MTKNSTDFAELVSKFVSDYLPFQRNYSKNTILSYRDTFKLFLRFLTQQKNIDINRFSLKDFNRELVLEFLENYRDQGGSISSANQRLAAFKSFAAFAQIESVENMASLQGICNIKSTKTVKREIPYLSVEQMSRLVNAPDINQRTGFRHKVLLALLYDSGCRVQELCDLKLSDLNLEPTPTVRLFGKGRKYRSVVISDKTAQLIRTYLKTYRSRSLDDEYLILNKYGNKINRDGVKYVIKKYIDQLHTEDSGFPEHVTPHMFRHSKAMHMLEAGINLVYIRDFLGHEDISTTMIYLKASNKLKNEAISKIAPVVAADTEVPAWDKDKDLLAFLNSLK